MSKRNSEHQDIYQLGGSTSDNKKDNWKPKSEFSVVDDPNEVDNAKL